MTTKKSNFGKKVILAGAGAAAIAGSIAAAVALSDKKNRKKVEKFAKGFQAQASEVFNELKKMTQETPEKK